jgi:hypothetical protein
LQVAANERRAALSTIETATEIRTFNFEITHEQTDDLRRRIAATRWPSKELVNDREVRAAFRSLR